MYKKITMLAVLVVLAGAGCVAVQNNENKPKQEEKKVENTTVTTTENTVIDTSNWKTYENKEYGFSFRYPSDFFVDMQTEGGPASNIGDLYIHDLNYECFIQLDKPTETGIEDIDLVLKKYYKDKTDITKITFNNLVGFSYSDIVNEEHEKGLVYNLKINQKWFSYLVRSGLNSKKCIDISKNILSTFVPNL